MSAPAFLNRPVGETQFWYALVLAVLMAFVVGSALAFELIGGYIPCALCLAQREPYYAGVPVMLVAAMAAWFSAPACVTRGLLVIGGLLMVYGLVLGVYHSGVEWQWWAGPATCATGADGLTSDAGSLLADLNAKRPPSCDKAALRVLGLSFAGWNVLASLALATIAFRGARA